MEVRHTKIRAPVKGIAFATFMPTCHFFTQSRHQSRWDAIPFSPQFAPNSNRVLTKSVGPYAKKKDGSKRSKKRVPSQPNKKEPGKDSSFDLSRNTVPDLSSEARPAVGPIAPELLQADGPIAPPQDDPRIPIVSAGDDDDGDENTLPIADEARLRLPDLSSTTTGVRRKRKPLSSAKDKSVLKLGSGEEPSVEEVAEAASEFSFDEVRDLTTAYQLGDEGRQKLIDEIEKEPDFVMKTTKKNYDMTSAIFGRGQPNSQGVYVLPYLQSAHLVLTGIALLVAFVYYPGFPLTESTEEVRDIIKKGISITYAFNAFLAVLAYRSAGQRAQPPLFWALKTLVLGELAFGELRRNTSLAADEVGSRPKQAKRQKKRANK